MVVHRSRIGFVEAGNPFIFAEHGAVKPFDSVSHGASPFWAVLRNDEAVFVFVQHRNFHFAAPAPEGSHGCLHFSCVGGIRGAPGAPLFILTVDIEA